MRSGHHVRQTYQLPGHVGEPDVQLAFKYIQPCSTKPPLLQRSQKRTIIDQAATRCVDQKCSAFHLGQSISIDEMPGLRRERCMNGNEVTTLQKRLKIDVFDTHRMPMIGRRPWGVHQDGGIEAFQPLYDIPGDAAQTNHAHCFGIQIASQQDGAWPIHELLLRFANAMRSAEHQSQSAIRYAFFVATRSNGHYLLGFDCRVQVNFFVAHSTAGNDFEPRQRLEQTQSDPGMPDDPGIGLRQHCNQLGRRRVGIVLPLRETHFRYGTATPFQKADRRLIDKLWGNNDRLVFAHHIQPTV